MRTPSAGRLVSAWEAGAALPAAERALELLAAAEPGAERPALASLPLDERDQRLLRLRLALFGSRMDATTLCPGCDARVEFGMEVETFLQPLPCMSDPIVLDVDGQQWHLRLPASVDLLAVVDRAPADAEHALLERCLTRADGGPSDAPVTDDLRRAAAGALAALRPHMDIQLSAACPGCGHEWLADFDVVSFLWSELATDVRRLLRDVHRLASAYGWAEADIIAMPHRRRAAYLEMLGT